MAGRECGGLEWAYGATVSVGSLGDGGQGGPGGCVDDVGGVEAGAGRVVVAVGAGPYRVG